MNPSLVILFAALTLTLLFWPRAGVLPRWRKAQRLAARVRREDALKHILKREANGQSPTLEGIGGLLQLKPNAVAALIAEMERGGLVTYLDGRLRLTPAGRELALHIVRTHRLWESYLAEQTGIAEVDWHREADRQEHLLTAQQTDALAASLGNPTRDPHGDEIPATSEDLRAPAGSPLNAAPAGEPMRIEHIEDEPATVYSQLVAAGLRAGMKVVVIEKGPQRVRFWADGNAHVLAPSLAHNIEVVPLPEVKAADVCAEEFLSNLTPGRRARVLGLSPACRGAERRRLLDLGLVPGTEIEVELVSPAGDPSAYRVRGSVIALRRDQANLIRIAPAEVAA
jgi:DtxR family Mn-dependent transcriptional regulator